MVLNATFDNIWVILWRSIFGWKKLEYPGKPPTCLVALTNFITYHTITTTTAPHCRVLTCLRRMYIYMYIDRLFLSDFNFRFEGTRQWNLRDDKEVIYGKVWQWLAAGRWFSPDTSVSSINKTDRHNITEILLKVALNTINLNLKPNPISFLQNVI
jgi:hypothetical protein